MKKLIAEFCISSTLHHENVVSTVDLIQDEVLQLKCGSSESFTPSPLGLMIFLPFRESIVIETALVRRYGVLCWRRSFWTHPLWLSEGDGRGQLVGFVHYCPLCNRSIYPWMYSYFKQLVQGVDYLHSMGVAHRDLKPGMAHMHPLYLFSISTHASTLC